VTADLAALVGLDVPTGMFIDGEWVDSPEHYEIRSPANGELVAVAAFVGSTRLIDNIVLHKLPR